MACALPDDVNWQENKLEQIDEISALESIYYDCDMVTVVTSAEDDDEAQYVLQLSVPVILPNDTVTVEAYLQLESDIQTCENRIALLSTRTRPKFERTISEKKWRTSFKLSHLRPILLDVTLPHSYPSDGAPQFLIECQWLNKRQLTSLCLELDALWGAAQNMPVLFTWIDWLQNSALSFLGLDDVIVLTRHLSDADCDVSDVDSRVQSNFASIHEDLVNLLRHDLECTKRKFLQDVHTCGICFDDKTGAEFVILERCGHHFCRECMMQHCEMHTKEGSVHSLMCADNDCDDQIPQYLLKSLLSDENFDRYERLHLQKTLETMGDVEYCPRCQFVVLVERDTKETLGHCLQCMFTFCTCCRDPYHAGSACVDTSARLAALSKKQLSAKLSEADRARIERNLKYEYLNIAEVKRVSKPCPRCRIDIHKYDGCNKVVCGACGGNMCWLCGQAINGYEHFSERVSKCILFAVPDDINWDMRGRHLANREVPEQHRRIQETLAVDPGAARLMIKCPRCGQQNMKHSTNNHIRCWSCRGNFCFQCKSLISGNIMTHYNAAMPCNQHTLKQTRDRAAADTPPAAGAVRDAG